jgi:hypothetical protein
MHDESVCSKYFMCFSRMLQMFHLNVSNIDLGVALVTMAIHACFKCFIYFQTYVVKFHVVNVYLDISKVDLVLHMLHTRMFQAYFLKCFICFRRT